MMELSSIFSFLILKEMGQPGATNVFSKTSLSSPRSLGRQSWQLGLPGSAQLEHENETGITTDFCLSLLKILNGVKPLIVPS